MRVATARSQHRHTSTNYNILQTSKDENLMRAIRNGLHGAGITVENSKGEAWAGQEEINVRYDAALPMADTHVFLNTPARKSPLGLASRSPSWPSRTMHGRKLVHIHQSLWSADGKQPLFFDKGGDHGMSDMMKHYVAGLLAHSDEITYFLAPISTPTSALSQAPLRLPAPCGAFDNRTAGYRLCGADSKAVRVECRVGEL